MLDIKLIRNDIKAIKKAMEIRNQTIDFKTIIELDENRKLLISEIESLRNIRNRESEKIGLMKSKGENPSEAMINEINSIRNTIQEKEKALGEIESKIEDLMLYIPNIPDASVPIGKDEKDNKVVKVVGETPIFSFKPKAHWELGETLGILDFKTASKISGSRFAIFKNEGAILVRAIIDFFLDFHRERGYQEILTPYLVNYDSMRGTGQLPKFKEEAFKCESDDLYLIPTAEVSVTNIYRDDCLNENILPQKFVSYSACFRREAGAYGKDTKGLIRNHQFDKVELVKFVKPEDSMKELELLVEDAASVLKELGLAYRVSLLCAADLGFSSAKTYDLEVWLPSENTYREISSCSNFKDYQARRMNIKMKYTADKKRDFLHTLNGSGVAVGRTLVAILENFQQKDGSIIIPQVLRKYTKFDSIKAK